jgi:titin
LAFILEQRLFISSMRTYLSFILLLLLAGLGQVLAQPPVPLRFTAEAISSSQINLQWADLSDNETSFELERGSGPRGPFTNIATLPANTTTYQHTGLTGDTRYCYRVRAVNSQASSDYSDAVCATTLPLTIPATPVRLTATAVSSSRIDLEWGDLSDNEVNFLVERSPDGRNFTQIASLGANTTTYQSTGLEASTQYYYRVRASNGAGNSAYSNTANATTQAPPVVILAAPTGLRASAISSTQINLSWTDNADNEANVLVERSPDGRNFTQIASLAANTTTYQNTGLTASTRYWYRVRVSNVAGLYSAYSNEANTTTLAPPVTIPAAPTTLTATAASSTQINLSWADNANNEVNFLVERSANGTNFTQIASLDANTTTYQSTGLEASTQYYYRVRASNTAGNSAYSNTANATTQAPPVTIPAAPSTLTATAVSSTQINLNWTDNSNNEVNFLVERSPNGTTFTQIASLPANTTTYQNTGLAASTTYYYRVRANNTAGNSAYSNTANATTQAPPLTAPTAPTTLNVSSVSSTQINLSWTDNSNNEVSFLVERSPNGTNFTQIASLAANTTTFQNTGLTASTQYWYRVRASNTAGNSAYTNIANATTQAPPVTIPATPTTLTATAASSTQINLSWTDNANNEVNFLVERSANGTNFTQIASLGANTTTYQSTGLTASTQYWYRVRASNTAGNSAYSNTANATTGAVSSLAAPQNLTAIPIDYDNIKLEWNPLPANVTEVIIERSANAGNGFIEIGRQNAAIVGFSDREILPVADYYYRIKAIQGLAESPYSNVTTVLASAIITGESVSAAKPATLIYAYNHTLYVRLPSSQHNRLTVHSLNGTPVFMSRVTQPEWQTVLPLLSPGVYVVKIESTQGILHSKIIVQP